MTGGASPPTPRRLSRLVIAACIALIALLGIGSLLVISLSGHNKPVNYQSTAPPKVLPSTANGKLQLQDVLVNGQLHVNNGIILKPSTQPTNPSLGQLYISSDTKQLSYFNGTAFVPVGSGGSGSTASPAETVLGVTSNLLKLGNGLTLNQNTIVNSGITNLLGTQNQIAVSSATGSVTLGLPSSVSVPGSITAGNFIGNGSSLTNLNASNLTAGTIADSVLSPNVTLLNRNDQSFSGRRQVFRNSTNDTNAFSIQAADGTPELSVDTVNNQLTVTNLLPAVPGVLVSGVTINSIITPSVGIYNDNSSFTALGNDGFVQFVYFDNNGQDVHLVHCTNATCTTSTNVVVASDANGVNEPSIAVGPDGFARIAYVNYNSPNELHYIRCENSDCSTKVDTLVYNHASASLYNTSIKLGSDGFARIVFDDGGQSPHDLNLAHCLNADCTSVNTTVLVTSTGYLEANSQALGPDGFLRIAYTDRSNHTIHFVQCTNADCTSPNNSVVDTVSGSYYVSLAIAPDGFGRLAYANFNSPKYAQCTNASCSTSNITTLDGNISNQPDVVIGSDGLARISYQSNPPSYSTGSLNYIDCTNAACTGSTPLTVITGNSSYNYAYPSSMVLGNDGLARIVFGGAAEPTINFALFDDASGEYEGSVAGTTIGSSSDPFGTIYATQIDTNGIKTSGSGQLLIQASTNNTSAFQVQDAAGNGLLNVDTVNNAVIIGGNSNLAPSSIGTGAYPTSVIVNGSYAYVMSNDDELQIFNVSIPASPSLVSATATNQAVSVAVSGNFAYVANFGGGMQIFNVSNPASPSLVGSATGDSGVYSIAVSGNYVYLTSSESNTLQIFNVSNPASPSLVSTTAVGGTPYYYMSVAVSSNYAYVKNGSLYSMQIFNISNPASPSLVSTTSAGNSVGSLAINGNYVYVVGVGLQIFNVSNPASPSLVATTPTAGQGVSVAINNSYAYVLNGNTSNSGSLQIFNVSNPASPSLVATTPTGDNPDSMAASGNYAYVVNEFSNSLQIFNVSNPANLNNLIDPSFQVQNSNGTTLLTANTADQSLTVNGTATFKNAYDFYAAFQIQDANSGSVFSVDTTAADMSVTINGQDSNFNYSGAALYVGKNSITGRSINAAGTINAAGADYAEWIPWSGTKPGAGSVVSYQGSDYVVSSPTTAAFVGNDGIDEANAIMVTFAGQVPVAVTGLVNAGDILVANGDGTAIAISPSSADLIDYLSKIGIAEASSSASSVKLIETAVGTTGSDVSQAVQQSTSTNFSSINISGIATIHNLTVQTLAVSGNLTVTGTTTFIGAITVDGHIITGNSSGSTTASNGAQATCTLNGNDTDGTLQIVTSGAPASGTQCTINFANAFSTAPNPIVSPKTANAAGLFYTGNVGTSSFTVDAASVPAGNATYKLNYFNAQ
jgi:hypothetical protein